MVQGEFAAPSPGALADEVAAVLADRHDPDVRTFERILNAVAVGCCWPSRRMRPGCRARGGLPEATALTERPRSSHLLKQARRLRDTPAD
ncbi:hypothetical protein [Streptomyces sp. NPDC054865]